MATLDNVRSGFVNEDASSRLVLASATDETAVQNWLAEQLKLRAKDRFYVHREVEVAERNEPDIVVSSTAAPCEVAVEVKHANMGCTVQKLEHSLLKQLAFKYLRPASRRHGIFVVTLHNNRTWRHPETKTTMSFDDLIGHLEDIASHIEMNATGPIDIRVVGINASTVQTSEGQANHISTQSSIQ